MFQDYRWVAMLDPVELADGIDRDTEPTVAPLVVEAVTEVEHAGRPAWEAVVATTPAYEPRCGCCPLLRTRDIDLLEYRDYPEYLLPVYPEAYRVRLDVGTGVCVFTDEIGGPTPGGGHDLRIEAVDEPMDDGLFEEPPPGAVPPALVAGADLADGAEQHPERGQLLLPGRRPGGGPRVEGALGVVGGVPAAGRAVDGGLGDLVEGGSRTSSAVTWASPNDADARGVDDHAAVGQVEQHRRRRRVPALADLADVAGGAEGVGHEPVDQGRLADAGLPDEHAHPPGEPVEQLVERQLPR